MLTTQIEAEKRAAFPANPAERALVQEQLARMLVSPLFRQSKRYAPFLRFVVEAALNGRREELKERTLGVEIFGRLPDYDSGNDPIVRVTAGEVRRRIAQYYNEPGRENELRITVSPGSYVPAFIPTTPYMREPATPESREARLPSSFGPEPLDKPVSAPEHNRRPIWLAVLIAVAVLLVSGSLLVHHSAKAAGGAVDQWWHPALQSSAPVLFSVGTPDSSRSMFFPAVATKPSKDTPTVESHINTMNLVSLSSALALESFASVLATHNQPYRTLTAVNTQYADLRAGPAVLLCGLDNPWTMRITEPLRFHFMHPDDGRVAMIADREHPEQTGWRVDFDQPYSSVTKDYALVARLHDGASEKPILIAAGIGSNGTSAAAEFLSSESALQTLISRLPAHWQDKNIEAVVETRVIGGQTGPPILTAVHWW